MIRANTIFLFLLTIFPLISLEFLPISLVLIFVSLLIIRTKYAFGQVPIYIISIGTVFYIRSLFGSLIIPESTISFLATMCLARFLAKDNTDYRINRLLGFLWAGCFILFRTDLLAIISLVIVTLLILKTLAYEDDEKVNIRQLFLVKDLKIKDLVLGVILVVVLFVFFPRIYNFLPGVRNQAVGQIGYSKTINNSNSGQLRPSSQTAFIAQIKELPNEQLYWRGRVHAYTDGYNWRGIKLVSRTINNVTRKKLVTYTIKYEQDFDSDMILLDTPIKINSSNLRSYKDNEFHTFKSYTKQKKAFVSATSSLDNQSLTFEPKNNKQYLQLPKLITKEIEPLIKFVSSKSNLEETLLFFKDFIQKEKFYYTLSPRSAVTMKDFLKNKEGFCTHYASLLGIVLRKLNYPTRLVSGFQGGLYNKVGEHYKVSSNDAHAWVEVYDGRSWLRVDPTEYIAPNRILRGGESFFTGSPIVSEYSNKNKFSLLYYNAKQYWDNLNYKVSLFFDTYDRGTQKDLSKIFKVKRYIFILIGVVLFIILLSVLYFVNFAQKLSPIDQNFNSFQKYLLKYNVEIDKSDSLSIIRDKVLNAKLEKSDLCIAYIDLYQNNKYSKNKNLDDLEIQLKKII